MTLAAVSSAVTSHLRNINSQKGLRYSILIIFFPLWGCKSGKIFSCCYIRTRGSAAALRELTQGAEVRGRKQIGVNRLGRVSGVWIVRENTICYEMPDTNLKLEGNQYLLLHPRVSHHLWLLCSQHLLSSGVLAVLFFCNPLIFIATQGDLHVCFLPAARPRKYFTELSNLH